MTAKLLPEERKMQILNEALAQAATCGYQNIKCKSIADKLGLVTGTVHHHWATMPDLRRGVLRYAISQAARAPRRTILSDNSLRVLAQGIAANDRLALKAPDALKREALQTLV